MRTKCDPTKALSTIPGSEKGLDSKEMSIIVTHSFTQQGFLSLHDRLGAVLIARDNGLVLGHLRGSGHYRQTSKSAMW